MKKNLEKLVKKVWKEHHLFFDPNDKKVNSIISEIKSNIDGKLIYQGTSWKNEFLRKYVIDKYQEYWNICDGLDEYFYISEEIGVDQEKLEKFWGLIDTRLNAWKKGRIRKTTCLHWLLADLDYFLEKEISKPKKRREIIRKLVAKLGGKKYTDKSLYQILYRTQFENLLYHIK
jgi:hypothetical protein